MNEILEMNMEANAIDVYPHIFFVKIMSESFYYFYERSQMDEKTKTKQK